MLKWLIAGISVMVTGAALIAFSGLVGTAASLARVSGCLYLGTGAFLLMIGLALNRIKSRRPPSSRYLSVTKALCEALKNEEWNARYLAATVLRELGAMARDAVPQLIELLDDPHDWVRDAAREALKAIEPEALDKYEQAKESDTESEPEPISEEETNRLP